MVPEESKTFLGRRDKTWRPYKHKYTALQNVFLGWEDLAGMVWWEKQSFSGTEVRYMNPEQDIFSWRKRQLSRSIHQPSCCYGASAEQRSSKGGEVKQGHLLGRQRETESEIKVEGFEHYIKSTFYPEIYSQNCSFSSSLV